MAGKESVTTENYIAALQGSIKLLETVVPIFINTGRNKKVAEIERHIVNMKALIHD